MNIEQINLTAPNKDKFLELINEFWDTEYNIEVTSEHIILANGFRGIFTSWIYDSNNIDKSKRGRIGGSFTSYPKQLRGTK